MASRGATVRTLILRIGTIENDRGFTVLELLVIICIAGLASGAFVFSMSSLFSRSRFETITSELEREFSHVADAARRTGRDQVVYMRSSERTTEFTFGRKSVRVAEPISIEWIAAAEAGTSTDLGVIVFLGVGGSSGGVLRIASGKSKASITIDWLSGRIRAADRHP
jgi:general secretion pathway protein H